MNTKDFLKIFFSYSVSLSFERASHFLMVPILASSLTLQEIGLFGLMQVIGSIFSNVINFNGGAGIIKAVHENDQELPKVFVSYFYLSFVVVILLLPVLNIFFDKEFIQTILFFSFSQSMFYLFGAYLRATFQHKSYSFFLICRAFLNVGIVLFVGNIYAIFNILSFFTTLLTLFFFFTNSPKVLSLSSWKVFKPLFLFSTSLLVLPVSQWIMSSGDRILIKKMLDDKQLGIYTLGYSIAMFLMLLNVGLAQVLPQYYMKYYHSWKSNVNRLKFQVGYAFLSFFLFVVLCAAVEVNNTWLHWIQQITAQIKFCMLLAYLGMYFLGHYYFYSNILFVESKGGIISVVGVLCGLLNLVMNIFMIPSWGIYGAAASTVVCYFLYQLLISCFCRKYIKHHIFLEQVGIVVGALFPYGFFLLIW
ncbi:MAG: polysaccharide biosynthesis C-terminal domain-containing protein [Bdellovibrionota bacterium]